MKEEKLSEIYFNSKSKEVYKELSNFYGDVEISYMQKRFYHPKMKDLFEEFKTCDNHKFIFFLKLFQPDKKFNEWKERYWFNGDEPIRGILAKLVGAIVVKPDRKKKRINAISEYLSISVEEVIQSDKVTTDEDMYECLMKKYSIDKYKKLLLSTGDVFLHEKPFLRPNEWTYKNGEGGDKLGKMLMKIRDILAKLANNQN